MADREQILAVLTEAFANARTETRTEWFPRELAELFLSTYETVASLSPQPADDQVEEIKDRIQQYRKRWSKQFGGGMLPFDNVYFDACRQDVPTAEAQRRGMNALLDEFVAGLCAELSAEFNLPAQGGRND